ncbi:MAG: FtsX-like permease family protein [Verrucomicrobia bacterium]|nr:MAG: FtsX-like permease family protein [Verrucomicrobiota bacterium]
MNRALHGLLLRRFALRHWRAAPRQTALLVAVLALGIAVYFSIRLANRAAVASFRNFAELLAEESDWIVSAPAGLLPESVLSEIRGALGDRAVDLVPVLESTAALPRAAGGDDAIGARATFHLLGVDLVGVQNAAARRGGGRAWFGQTNATAAGTARGFWDVFRDPRAVFVPARLALREGLRVGGELRLLVNERVVALNVAGIIPSAPGQPAPPDTLLVMDLPALQSLTGRHGRIDRVEVRVEAGPGRDALRAETRDILARTGGDRWLVGSPGDRRAAGEVMTRAFRLNLTILSLIALLVGLYLVFQALDGAVVRRREEIGILRSLGVEERAIRAAWWAEAAALGLAGGVLGSLLGWAGAQFSVRFVGRTVNALYYATSAQSAALSLPELLGAVGLSVSAALVAGWLPAREAARTPPAQILSRHAVHEPGRGPWSRAWFGAALAGTGILLAFAPPLRFDGGLRVPAAGYAAALLWILGGGVLTGGALAGIARLLAPLGKRSAPWRLALAALRRPSGRHRLAAAGLLCAIAMTAGMAILVASFDRTMRGWIERTFQADLYLASDGAQSASAQNRIDPSTWRAIAADPAVADWNVLQVADVTVSGMRTLLVGAELGFTRRHTPLAWRDAPGDDGVFDPARNAGSAFVSEAFTERFRMRRGDAIDVPTPTGKRRLRIAGVFSDYGNERGSIVVERRHFAEWFGDELGSSLVLFLKPGHADEAVRADLARRYPGLRVLTNAHLRREVLRIFSQTFAITYALELIGVVVAVAGLGLTLASVLLERRGDLTTLRALGMARGEMARAAAAEGAVVALAGTAGGLGVSAALGWLLIHVINRQTFGWTLQYGFPAAGLAALAGLVVATGTTVAYGVGRWGAALPADREE